MDKHYPLEFRQKQAQTLRQMQRLIMSPQMQQALHLLQMPILELSQAVNQEMETNPVLEYSQPPAEEPEEPDGASEPVEKELAFNDKDFDILKQIDEDFQHLSESSSYRSSQSSEELKRKAYLESYILAEETLFEHLMQQAKDSFATEEEVSLAEMIIGSLNDNGYLTSSLHEIAILAGTDVKMVQKILKTIQGFDPYGVGAANLQESMLIQMRCLNKNDTLAYKIIDEQFDNLLHNRIPLIQKHFHCSLQEIEDAIGQQIAKLDLHPGAWYTTATLQTIVPDLTIVQEDDHLIVVIHDDSLPQIRLNPRYLRMLEDPSLSEETKEFIHNKIVSAKWLLRNILQRNDTLEKIGHSLIKHQKEFVSSPQGALKPMTMKMLAEEISVHESTVARAVNHKYIDTPRGTLPLRSFFTSSLDSLTGEDVSSSEARTLLKDLIDRENKQEPLSDDALANLIQEQGIRCARRTVAKYRALLGIGNAHQRRKY